MTLQITFKYATPVNTCGHTYDSEINLHTGANGNVGRAYLLHRTDSKWAILVPAWASPQNPQHAPDHTWSAFPGYQNLYDSADEACQAYLLFKASGVV